MINAEQYLSTTQLKQRWSCCVETITRRVKAGKLPHIRIGNQYRFSMADVLAYEATRKNIQFNAGA